MFLRGHTHAVTYPKGDSLGTDANMLRSALHSVFPRFSFLCECLDILYMKNNCWFKIDHGNKVTIFLFMKLLFFYDVQTVLRWQIFKEVLFYLRVYTCVFEGPKRAHLGSKAVSLLHPQLFSL